MSRRYKNRLDRNQRDSVASQLKRIAHENPRLRPHIRRILKAGSYYHYEDGMTIEEVASRWADNQDKLYDEHIHAWMSLREVWPHREYTWTRDTARSGMVRTEDGQWQEKRGPQKWDHIKADMERNGWREKEQPAIVYVGKDGTIKVAEGNHRLAIAQEIGLRKVPVRFMFVQEVRR